MRAWRRGKDKMSWGWAGRVSRRRAHRSSQGPWLDLPILSKDAAPTRDSSFLRKAQGFCDRRILLCGRIQDSHSACLRTDKEKRQTTPWVEDSVPMGMMLDFPLS